MCGVTQAAQGSILGKDFPDQNLIQSYKEFHTDNFLELFIKSADTIFLLLKRGQSPFSLYVGIFYPSGELISSHLLRYSTIAVDDHSFMRCASYI